MMSGQWIDLEANDGFGFGAYLAERPARPKGAVVVLPEIFGINPHIRSVCDRLAQTGYVSAAPRLFDRVRPDYEAGYAPEDVQRGIALMKDIDLAKCELDIAATIEAVAEHGPVSLMGFCLGGSLAYRMATLSDDIACAVCYYGGMIEGYADLPPKCPVVLHYGETDHSIPPENVATVRRKQPDLPVHLYPAGHGFNCDARASFEPASAALAWERSMKLIDSVSGG